MKYAIVMLNRKAAKSTASTTIKILIVLARSSAAFEEDDFSSIDEATTVRIKAIQSSKNDNGTIKIARFS